MSPKVSLAFLLFTSLVALSRGQSVPLTKDVFESAFRQPFKSLFEKFPYFGHLFLLAPSKQDVNGTVDTRFVPLCVLNLGKYGSALPMNNDCIEKIDKIQAVDKKLSSIYVAYRCYKSKDVKPLEYELRTVSIDRTFKDTVMGHDIWVINFTPKEERSCRPLFMEDVGIQGLQDELKSQAPELTKEVNSVEKAVPLTKETFEESIPLPELFHSNRQLTYIFVRELENTALKRLVPLKECIVTMFEEGKGMVHPGCADKLKVFQGFDADLRNALLPYRCFLHDNALEYELKTTFIDKLAHENGQYVIYYQVDEFHNCSPKFGSNEDLGKSDDDEDEYDRITREEL